jgi:hypothetical protein
MAHSKIIKSIIITGTLFLIIFCLINLKNLQCSKFGDFLFDKLLGLNSDCYERKIRGVINPHVKNQEARYAYTKDKKKINCPNNSIVIIISGQSNSSNFLKSFKRYKNKHVNYYNKKCYNLSNPSLGAEGEMSSIAPALASKLNNFKKIIFITSGRGGKSIVNSDDNNRNFINYNIQALKEMEKKNNYLKFFIWIQGESDVGNSQKYTENFNNIYDSIVSNSNNKENVQLIITQTTKCKSKEDKYLRAKQKEISLSKNKFINIINTDLLGNEFRYDDCHFNEKGIEKISEDLSNIIKKLLPK